MYPQPPHWNQITQRLYFMCISKQNESLLNKMTIEEYLPAAFKRRMEAGGVFKINVKLLSYSSTNQISSNNLLQHKGLVQVH